VAGDVSGRSGGHPGNSSVVAGKGGPKVGIVLGAARLLPQAAPPAGLDDEK